MLHKNKKNKLRAGKNAPRLVGAGYEYEENDRLYTYAFRRWSTLYLATAISAILAVAVLLFSGSVGKHAITGGAFWGKTAEHVAALFFRQDFFDLSGNTSDDTDGEKPGGIVDVLDQLFHPDKEQDDYEDNTPPTSNGNKPQSTPNNPPLTQEMLYSFDYDAVPDGKTPVIPMNLALESYGASYIHNSTGYRPDTAALLAGKLKQTVDFEYLVASGSPMVLIVHTHATESFCEDGATYCDTTVDYARSKDTSENMIAVGKALSTELEKRGIRTLHCTVLHDEIQYKDSYRRSEESIRQYLEKYPTIRLVIDLHRDAVVQSDGDVVRPVTLYGGQAAAQLMCVVGSSYGGESCPNWEGNLALALKLRELLNAKCSDICRPPYLKSSTYNQELAPYSLLIEAGAGGNSLEEVLRTMPILADSLRELLPQI